MLKKCLYNQNDDGLEELEDDPELKELDNEDLESDELGETEDLEKTNENEGSALDEEN